MTVMAGSWQWKVKVSFYWGPFHLDIYNPNIPMEILPLCDRYGTTTIRKGNRLEIPPIRCLLEPKLTIRNKFQKNNAILHYLFSLNLCIYETRCL